MASWRYPRITRSKFLFVIITFLLSMLVIHMHNENTSLNANFKALKASNLADKTLIDKLQHDIRELQARNKCDQYSQNRPSQPVTKEVLGRRVATSKPMAKLQRVLDPKKLSIIVYDKGGAKIPNSRLDQLRMMFPKSTFFLNDNKDNNLANTLNKIIPNVKTEYFLFMEPNVLPSDRPHEGVELLWNRML